MCGGWAQLHNTKIGSTQVRIERDQLQPIYRSTVRADGRVDEAVVAMDKVLCFVVDACTVVFVCRYHQIHHVRAFAC